jgi:hypothetical protein
VFTFLFALLIKHKEKRQGHCRWGVWTHAEHALVDAEEESGDAGRAERRLGENTLQAEVVEVTNKSEARGQSDCGAQFVRESGASHADPVSEKASE